MGSRGTRLPRDQRRIQLLDAASEVFTSKGYHAAAMDDIADAAGVSKPVLYQHFPSKLDLYLALLDQSCDRLVEIVEEALSSNEDNADRVVATVAAFYEFVSSESGEFRFVFESDLTGDGAVQQRLSRVNDEISDAIAEVIAEDTSLPAQQAKLLAVSLVGIAQVSARYWISGGTSTITLDEAKQLVSSLAWRGISGFPLSEHDGPTQYALIGIGEAVCPAPRRRARVDVQTRPVEMSSAMSCSVGKRPRPPRPVAQIAPRLQQTGRAPRRRTRERGLPRMRRERHLRNRWYRRQGPQSSAGADSLALPASRNHTPSAPSVMTTVDR